MTPEYLAGYLDGEACIDIYRVPNRMGLVCGVGVSSCYTPILESLHAMFGGAFRPAHDPRYTGKPAWSWQVQGQNAYNVCSRVHMHMLEKHEQACILMKFWEWRRQQPQRGVDWTPALGWLDAIKRAKQGDYD